MLQKLAELPPYILCKNPAGLLIAIYRGDTAMSRVCLWLTRKLCYRKDDRAMRRQK